MALPFTSLPHVLAVDDVVPAELAQRVLNKCNDAVSLINAEHKIEGPEVGLHDVITIPVAVAQIVIPSGGVVHTDHALSTHFSVGIVGSPQWSVWQENDYDNPDTVIERYSISVVVPDSVYVIGAAATARSEWGKLRFNVPVVTTSTHGAAFFAWPADHPTEKVTSVLLALYGTRRA